MTCETTNFAYPLLADVYYPIVEQVAGYGSLKKRWVLDRTIACALNSTSSKTKEDIIPNVDLKIDNILVGRTKNDLTASSNDALFSLTNIIIANVRDSLGNVIYNESAGIRSGKSTVFEIATFVPIVGPFGKTEYYKLIVRRSENQAVDL